MNFFPGNPFRIIFSPRRVPLKINFFPGEGPPIFFSQFPPAPPQIINGRPLSLKQISHDILAHPAKHFFHLYLRNIHILSMLGLRGYLQNTGPLFSVYYQSWRWSNFSLPTHSLRWACRYPGTHENIRAGSQL